MKKTIFVLIALLQAILLSAFIGLVSMDVRGFDEAIKIGWPKVYFTAFDAGNPTMNYGAEPENFIIDTLVALIVTLPLTALYRKLLK